MEEERAMTAIGADAGAGARGRVLVIEDDRALLEVYVDVLLEEGFRVAAAADTATALAALASAPFDAILSDIVMPGGSGIDVLRAVRERRLAIPVVLVTGNPSIETAIQALELGAIHYLVKPVLRAELVRAVAHATELRLLDASQREARRAFGLETRTPEDRNAAGKLLSSALDKMYMVYQPIMRLHDGSVFAWEALLRTRETAVAGPLAFLDLAQSLGQVQRLGQDIRAEVARTSRRTRGVMFFVNLHADDLEDEALYDAASPLSVVASEIVLEITERSPIEDLDRIRGQIERLRGLGYRLALDDLGSGYAGLTNFTALKPDFVKLDRGLVAGIDADRVRQRLVSTIVSVSREMGISVVAEGVETEGERDAMREAGCDLMQGFFFRRPEELKETTAFSLTEGS